MKLSHLGIAFIAMLFSFYTTQAQIKGTLNYQLTTIDGRSPQPSIVNFITYFTGSKSLEISLPSADIKESFYADGDNSLVKTSIIKSSKPLFVFKNFSTKELFQSDQVFIKRMLIADSLPTFKWKITNEHKKINKYKCTKALSNFRGRNYEAWFTEDIAIQNGPWKFWGLPGLIVEVKDSESIFLYELKGINLKAQFDAKIIDIPDDYKKDKPMTHATFMQALKKRIEQNEALARVTTPDADGNTSSIKITLPEKMEKF